MTTGKTIALTTWTFDGKVISLLFNMLPRLVIAFLPRSKCLLISWLQSPSTVILAPKKIKILFYLLRWNQDPAQSLHYCSGCSLLSLNPLLSLISNCLNLTFGTQGRSWRLEAGGCSLFPTNKEQETWKGFYAQDHHRLLLSFTFLLQPDRWTAF